MAKNSAKTSAEKTGKSKKHILGSGDKSDFIVNMTPEQTRKLCGVYSMIAMILMALSSVPYYISKAIGFGSSYMMLRTENNDTTIFVISTMLIATGFIGMVIFLIACMKNEVMVKRNKAMIIFVGIIISAAISALTSYDVNSGLNGYLDRAEGLISIIGYIGFFTIGICLTDEKWRRNASGTIIGIGTVNAVMGILQSIPALGKVIPSYYNFLFLGYKSEVRFAEYFNAYGAYDASYAADGLTCSPFALGALLTVAAAFAVNRAIYTESSAARVICLICTGIMSGAAVVTQTFPAMLGVGCVLVVSLIVSIADSKKNKGQVVSAVLSLVTAGVIAAGVCITDNFRMSNEQIIFTDSVERLGIANNSHSEHSDGIYSTLWYDGWLVFKENAVKGVGPDNWSTMSHNSEMMETDRTYNEYLDTAVTRGVLGLALYLIMLVITLVKAARVMKETMKNGGDKAAAVGAFTALICFAVQAFFNTTSICSTPFFYLMIGLIWSFEAKGRITSSGK